MLLLLQYGAQVNAVNSSQCSALHIAVNKQHVRCVQVLLRHGCDINVQVSLGSSPCGCVVKLSCDRYVLHWLMAIEFLPLLHTS